jgi:deoxyadenosine/deoxycytidine kinase
MRIAVSGTHAMGKSTLIEDFLEKHPGYKTEIEPYYKLQDDGVSELSLEPSLDSLLAQLDYSIEQLNENAHEQDIIFDRCPVDFIAYAMCIANQEHFDINDSEVSERFDEVKEALDSLDLIIFLPITKEHLIEYLEENPEYREAADKCFKKLYREDVCDIFPSHNHPRVVELWGDRAARIKKLEVILTED